MTAVRSVRSVALRSVGSVARWPRGMGLIFLVQVVGRNSSHLSHVVALPWVPAPVHRAMTFGDHGRWCVCLPSHICVPSFSHTVCLPSQAAAAEATTAGAAAAGAGTPAADVVDVRKEVPSSLPSHRPLTFMGAPDGWHRPLTPPVGSMETFPGDDAGGLGLGVWEGLIADDVRPHHPHGTLHAVQDCSQAACDGSQAMKHVDLSMKPRNNDYDIACPHVPTCMDLPRPALAARVGVTGRDDHVAPPPYQSHTPMHVATNAAATAMAAAQVIDIPEGFILKARSRNGVRLDASAHTPVPAPVPAPAAPVSAHTNLVTVVAEPLEHAGPQRARRRTRGRTVGHSPDARIDDFPPLHTQEDSPRW